MAVPYIYSPSTIIASSEMNTNLAYVDYTDIDNDKEIQWRDSGNILSSWIKQDSTDHVVLKIATASKSFLLRNNSDLNFFEGNTDTSYVGVLIGYSFRVYNSDDSEYLQFYSDGSNALYDTTIGAHIFRDPSQANSFGIDASSVAVYGGRQADFYGSGGSKLGRLQHDNTNFIISTQSSGGRIVFQPANSKIDCYADIEYPATNTYNIGASGGDLARVWTRSLSSGTTVDCLVEFRMTGGSSAVVAAYNTGSSKRAYIQHDDSYGIFGISANHMKFQTAANGDVIIFTRLMRRFQGTDTYKDDFVQRGSGYIQGDGTAAISRTHTFTKVFGSDNITVVGSFSGARATASGAPSDEGDLSGSGNFTVACTDVTTSNVLVTIERSAGTFSNATYYGYSLIAVGPI